MAEGKLVNQHYFAKTKPSKYNVLRMITFSSLKSSCTKAHQVFHYQSFPSSINIVCMYVNFMQKS